MNEDDPEGHVLNQSFGRREDDDPGPIAALLREAGKLDSRSAQLIMREAYEQYYGIYDHEHFSINRPLSIVAMHPKENTTANSAMTRIFYKYHQLEIAKHWNVSIDQFLSYPREYVQLMFKITEEKITREAPIIGAALKEMQRAQHEAGS